MSSAGSKPWNFGMVLPRGSPPNINMRPEDLTKCPRDELAVPEFEYEEDLYRAIDANADMAKTAAIRAGCTVVWIICPIHTSKYVYDDDGNKIPMKYNRHGKPVSLGTSEDSCHLHGHLNVVLDKKGFPVDFMKNGDARTMELFEWDTRRNYEEEKYLMEAADYEFFKAKTVTRGEGWEIEDDEEDGNYAVTNYDFEIPDYNPLEFQRERYYEQAGFNPHSEDYLVRKWNPYREYGHDISINEFGYSTQRFRNHHNPSPRKQRSHRSKHYR
ncbi:hypothetical protein F5B19DRAFT_487382 [Rostrohypoxylon terebratum]|nr:hypothetical protein F5B19DRAFT_487382 [Rostrohypoxylon terebratum]